MKRITALLLIMALLLAGCGAGESAPETTAAPVAETAAATEAAAPEVIDLSGQELIVFSGAGLANPVQEIADKFAAETGCTPQIVFAGTGQLITQIQTAEEGDILIAGAVDELASMKEEEITETIEIVKHIPVVAVQKGNPLGVTSVADLGAEGLTVLLPNPETTPIGKIAVKAFEEAGIIDTIDIVANTTTAPLAMTALAEKQADAAVVWLENAATNENIEVLDLPEMEKYIKVVPVVSLSYSTNEEARAAFVEYLTGEEGLEIWAKHGYQAVN